ncbi:hypothetical protein [Hydrogenovibrio kuenenii]|uniref:hypothetical protein n=1 Tax=Hydrogenovibrio kuenenii TaxID=63658 RepID=UPI0004669E70|nr:hypothetical protein [Hydrogenovibrio kuenenii]
MSQDQEPITPKANHRIIDVEANSAKDNHAHQASDKKHTQNKEPFQPTPSLFARTRNRMTQIFKKLGWVFLISVVALLGYLSWTNNQNDWQVEHINTLQAQVGQLKSDLKALKKQQIALTETVAQKKGLTPEEQTQIESIALFESKLGTLQQQVGELQSKSLLQSIPASGQDRTEKSTTPEKASVSNTEKNEFTQLSLDVQDMKRQLARLNNGQAHLVTENTALKDQLTSLSDNEGKKPVTTLSAMQIQHWAMQINTDWMLTGDEHKTSNALTVLQKAVEQSDLTEKSTLLTQIALDQQALQSHMNTSTDSALQAVTKMKSWITNWQPKEKASPVSNVSHETDTQASNETIWQKLEQKLLSLFSVRKRDDGDVLTQAEKIAQQGLIKQRFSLLLDRLQWAIISHSQQQLQSSRNALTQFVDSQLSENKTDIDGLLQPISNLKFVERQPLKVVGG